jgi:MFS family permease
MKFLAPSALRAAGFRTITVASAVGGGMLIAAMALFTAETPYPAIIATLLAGGFLRSLFFTSANVLAFADIDDKQAGQATAISAAAMQISIALGVACAGGLLEIVTMFSDGVLERSAFAVAFIAAGAIAVISAILYARLPRDVGAAISGHRYQSSLLSIPVCCAGPERQLNAGIGWHQSERGSASDGREECAHEARNAHLRRPTRNLIIVEHNRSALLLRDIVARCQKALDR